VSRLARFELVKDKTALSSISVQKNIVYEMEEIGVAIHSFTFDNGGENALHQELHDFGVKTYFCDPYCSYQKGAIENLNMFIRQYLPRSTDVSKLTSHDIYIIQEKLNNRPRKCLGYLTPNEFFYKKT
jgi:IS30 family transposase